MTSNSDLSSMWTSIQANASVDPALAKSITNLLFEDESKKTRSSSKRSSRTVKNKSSKNKSIFGNPLRNVSEDLVKLYKKNKKHKRIISPVFESLGFNKKSRKFSKWPILLKDFVSNLYTELAQKEPSKSSVKSIKEEIIETPKKIVKEPMEKPTRSTCNKTFRTTKIMQDEEMEDESKENLCNAMEIDKSSPVRNLHSPKPSKLPIKEEIKTEEAKKETLAKVKGAQTPKNFNIDMNCNESLSDLDKSEAKTIKTDNSPDNETRGLITGEKDYKPLRMSQVKTGAFPVQNNESVLHRLENMQNQGDNVPRPPFAQSRRNYSTLKRNLFSEFNSISPVDENNKKDTVDEIANPAKAINELKSPQVKQEHKTSILDGISPMKFEPTKFEGLLPNSLMATPLKDNGYHDSKDRIPPFSS